MQKDTICMNDQNVYNKYEVQHHDFLPSLSKFIQLKLNNLPLKASPKGKLNVTGTMNTAMPFATTKISLKRKKQCRGAEMWIEKSPRGKKNQHQNKTKTHSTTPSGS